jgi:hypothetical protein
MLTSSLHVLVLSGFVVVAIYVALVVGEVLGMTSSYLSLHNELGSA